MKVVGIIAEYNPFHLGHLYQINKIKEIYPDSLIIVLVSSSFTQRGEVSVVNKWEKTKVILENMVDMVVEFPFGYASQGADVFAKGAIEILSKLGIDTLVFGCETSNIDKLWKAAKLQLNNDLYDERVKQYLKQGLNYPTALNRSIQDVLGYVINKPNDLLALSYIKEIIRQKVQIEPVGIVRTNDYHSLDRNDKILSGQMIRKLILNNEDVCDYIVTPQRVEKNLHICNYFNYLKYQVINNIDCLDKFQTVDEGIENRIKKYIFESENWEDLVFKLKTKRYTYNKINRMLVHILTGFTKEENSKIKVDYIRLLGFSNKGRKYLKNISKDIGVPIVSNYRKGISPLFDLEFRINCIYALGFEDSYKLISDEYRHVPIIKD